MTIMESKNNKQKGKQCLLESRPCSIRRRDGRHLNNQVFVSHAHTRTVHLRAEIVVVSVRLLTDSRDIHRLLS